MRRIFQRRVVTRLVQAMNFDVSFDGGSPQRYAITGDGATITVVGRGGNITEIKIVPLPQATKIWPRA